MKKRQKLITASLAILLAAFGIYALIQNGYTAEAVTVSGNGLSEIGREFTVEREEDVAVLVEIFDKAERSEGPVKAIGNNLTITFHLKNGDAIVYPLWVETNGASFEDPTKETVTENGDVRYLISGNEWKKVLNILQAMDS